MKKRRKHQLRRQKIFFHGAKLYVIVGLQKCQILKCVYIRCKKFRIASSVDNVQFRLILLSTFKRVQSRCNVAWWVFHCSARNKGGERRITMVGLSADRFCRDFSFSSSADRTYMFGRSMTPSRWLLPAELSSGAAFLRGPFRSEGVPGRHSCMWMLVPAHGFSTTLLELGGRSNTGAKSYCSDILVFKIIVVSVFIILSSHNFCFIQFYFFGSMRILN